VIEAIAERLDWKRDLYAKIVPHLAPHAILATNTSGLSLAALSEVLPAAIRPRFCGVHFFNRHATCISSSSSPVRTPSRACSTSSSGSW